MILNLVVRISIVIIHRLHLQHNIDTRIMRYQMLHLKSSSVSSIFYRFLEKLEQNIVIYILIEVIQEVLILGLSDFCYI